MGYRRRRFTIFDLPPVKNFERKHQKLSLMILLILCIGILGFRYYRYQERLKIVEACTEQTEGVIVKVENSYTGRRHRTIRHRGVVEFEVDGEKYKAYTAWSTKIPHEGWKVDVFYDPDDPSRNCTDTGEDTNRGVGLAIAVILIAVIAVIVLIDYYRRQNGKSTLSGVGSGNMLSSAPENNIEQPNYDDIFK